MSGELDESIFHDQIEDFYRILGTILDEKRNPELDHYYEKNGNDINNYQFSHAHFSFQHKNGLHIQLDFTYALLFY
ncbi:hypothetical protein KFZ56_04090 [Virgibacillus sp. NKC19-3]|uniref:hypothetical protein n=1 Tax=Virgibacillus saliphilus TaxID=2831674 RepID=UPI001C9A9287|nr:hypothetical protein [Virgibacillus sp. NKC19-3]MBY7142286.1 hypothetical protein [Virgibacillus sp. NKC19-3]